MKNIVKVQRFKDNATRLYQLPAHYDVLNKGTIVEVEFGSGTAFGVTVSESYCGDYEEKMMRDLFNVLPSTKFKRVVAVYDRNEVDWPNKIISTTNAREATNGKILFIEEREGQEKTFPAGTETDLIFTEAAKMICFSDCSNVQDVKVVIDGKHYSYIGWEPGMLFTFKDDETGEEAWSNRFPEWDH